MQSSECSKLSPSERGRAPNCQGCPYQSQCMKGNAGEDPSILKIKEKLKNIKNIILILSGKGGVGKSTIASQLAMTLSENEKLNVGLLDIDICGPSIPKMLGIEDEEVHKSGDGWCPVLKDNLEVMSIGFLLSDKDNAIIWRGPRKNGLIVQFLTEVCWSDLDYLIIDTPPGTSDEHLSIVSYLKECNLLGALIVTTPQDVSLIDVRKEVNFCNKTDIKIIGVIENMSGFICPKCGDKYDIFQKSDGVEKMCKDFNINKICSIPIEIDVGKCTESGKCISKEMKESKTAKELEKIVGVIKEFK